MSHKLKDTEYLFLSTRIRVLERTLLTRERMERMLDAQTNEEAVKVLVECGYPEMPVVDVDTVNAALVKMREKVFEDLYSYAPDPAMIDVFKVKYDYHNVKTILKSEAMGLDPARLLVDCGRVPAAELAEQLKPSDRKADGDSTPLLDAAREARELLTTSHDPQRSDCVLDRAYFREMTAMAEATGSDFLEGYVRLLVDAANLKSLVRVLRMGKKRSFLEGILFEGGNVSVDRVLDCMEEDASLEAAYRDSLFQEAAALGQAAVHGGELTGFEKACDNALVRYVAASKYIPFGEQPVVAYLVAKENELTAVRIIMTGRLAGLSADTIRERLRESYV
ncbi:MAG: V-type ATPase subunit [Clostridiales bacterium]|nr:V-type ATPase subunit [Clostridiales bacterium]